MWSGSRNYWRGPKLRFLGAPIPDRIFLYLVFLLLVYIFPVTLLFQFLNTLANLSMSYLLNNLLKKYISFFFFSLILTLLSETRFYKTSPLPAEDGIIFLANGYFRVFLFFLFSFLVLLCYSIYFLLLGSSRKMYYLVKIK